MTKVDTVNSVIKFLELALSEEGLAFFLNIKKSFASDDELLFDFLHNYLTIQKGGRAPLENTLYADFTVYFDRFSAIQG